MSARTLWWGRCCSGAACCRGGCSASSRRSTTRASWPQRCRSAPASFCLVSSADACSRFPVIVPCCCALHSPCGVHVQAPDFPCCAGVRAADCGSGSVQQQGCSRAHRVGTHGACCRAPGCTSSRHSSRTGATRVKSCRLCTWSSFCSGAGAHTCELSPACHAGCRSRRCRSRSRSHRLWRRGGRRTCR
jgi:hypothetical protein